MEKSVENEVIYEESSGDTGHQYAGASAHPELFEAHDLEASAHHELPEDEVTDSSAYPEVPKDQYTE